MIYEFEFSINEGTASSKPCLWPKADTECQVWAQIFRSTFLKLVLEQSANVNKKIFIIFFKHDENNKHSHLFFF